MITRRAFIAGLTATTALVATLASTTSVPQWEYRTGWIDLRHPKPLSIFQWRDGEGWFEGMPDGTWKHRPGSYLSEPWRDT